MYRNTINTIRYNKTYCVLIATIILASYSINIVKEIDDTEPYPDYWENIIPMKMKCDYSITNTYYKNIDGEIKPHDAIQRGFLKYWINCFSYQYLGNDRIIPIMASVSIVYLTYVLANLITKDRIIGLISMGAMSINPMLTKFDSSPTYDQVWVAFFLLSIVLLYKKPIMGILSFPLSIFSKILAAGYIPGLILHVYFEKEIKHRKKILFGLVGLCCFGLIGVMYIGVGDVIEFHPERVLDGLLRIFEAVWPIFPFVMGAIVLDRFFISKTRPEGKRIILVWMALILLMTPVIYLFTPNQLQFGYRFVPFASFFSMYIGIVCVQLGNFLVEARLRKESLKSIS